MKKQLSKVLGLALVLTMGFATIAKAADDYKKFGVRFRAIYVKPNEAVDGKLNGVTNGALGIGNVSVGDTIIPELDLEYFFLKNFSAELIAGVSSHDVKLGNNHFGSTWLLPPTLTLKYHPLAGSLVSPYVGFGVNAIFPFNSKSNNLQAGTTNIKTDLRIDNSVGWAFQAGVDIKLTESLYCNLDYKYLNADTKASVAGTKYDLELNPNLFGIGIGYRF